MIAPLSAVPEIFFSLWHSFAGPASSHRLSVPPPPKPPCPSPLSPLPTPRPLRPSPSAEGLLPSFFFSSPPFWTVLRCHPPTVAPELFFSGKGGDPAPSGPAVSLFSTPFHFFLFLNGPSNFPPPFAKPRPNSFALFLKTPPKIRFPPSLSAPFFLFGTCPFSGPKADVFLESWFFFSSSPVRGKLFTNTAFFRLFKIDAISH